MTFHHPFAPPRLVAPGCSLSRAVATMAGELAIERAQIHKLRGAILRQIDEDMRRVDRCIAILDAMDGVSDCAIRLPGVVAAMRTVRGVA